MVPKVLGLLVSLVFSVPGVDWSPIDHLETFAGCKAVTAAERQAQGFKRKIVKVWVCYLKIRLCSVTNGSPTVYHDLSFKSKPINF